MTTHVEAFAARLRALKERSGRSYGQLAGRLHLSTSTLHRYCNGAAVPTEYAPVERLARLCGATPDELVALHRLWLLADAARRDPAKGAEQDPARAAGGAAVPAGAEGGTEPADAAGAEGGPEAVAGSEVRPAPVAEPAPQADAATAHLPAEAAVQPRAKAPAQLPAGVADDDADDAAVADLTAWPAAPGPAPRRSRRTALVLGAVAAIAVVTALPVTLHAWDGHARDAAAATPLATRGTTGAPTTPNGTPGPSASDPTTPAAPATTGSGRTPTPAPTATATGDDSGPPPFHVNVLADNWDTQCGQWFLMQQPPNKVPPPPSLGQTGAWAAALGGIPAHHLRLQLTAQTGTAEPIVLHALYVHVISSKPAPKGNAYTPGSGCGGSLQPASFAVDLDAAVPRSKPVPGYVGSGTTNVLSDFPYRISATDPQVLDVDASTAAADVSWYLELSWSSGARSGKAVVNDHGHPFRTVGLKGTPAFFYTGTTWSPSPLD